MALITTPAPGAPIEATWGVQIRDSVVQKFASLAALNGAWPTPTPGMVAYLEDTRQLMLRVPTAWVPVAYSGAGDAMSLGSVSIGSKAAVTGAEGGQLNFDASPSAPTTAWSIDVTSGQLRMFTGSTSVLQLTSGQVTAVRLLLAQAGLTVTGGAFTVNNGTQPTTFTTGDFTVNSNDVLALAGPTLLDLRTGGPGKAIRFISGAGFLMGSMFESGGWTDFKAAIPALGGGTTVTIQPVGNNQFGRASSSERYKTDITDAPDLSEMVNRLRPVAYHDNPETLLNATAEGRVGLLAEEVAEVAPEFVQWILTENCDCDISGVADDDPLLWDRLRGPHQCWRPDNVDYGRLVVPLIQMMRQQEGRIRELELALSAK